jgi:hypothetical protein
MMINTTDNKTYLLVLFPGKGEQNIRIRISSIHCIRIILVQILYTRLKYTFPPLPTHDYTDELRQSVNESGQIMDPCRQPLQNQC